MVVHVPVEIGIAEKFSGNEPNRLSHGWGDFDSMIETLERGLGDGPWLLGDTFSAADVMVGGAVVFLRMFGILPESAPLHAYADRCTARPAYQTAVALEESGD